MTDTVAGPENARRASEDILVVDADVHVHESPGALIPYCEMPWRVALRKHKRRAGVLPGHTRLLAGDDRLRGQVPLRAGGAPAWSTTRSRCAGSSMRSVDIGILFPDHFLKIPVIAQIDYAAALARAYNAWLLDKWCHPDKGLLDASSRVPRTRRTRRVRSGITRKNQAWSGCSCRARARAAGATGSTTRSTSSAKRISRCSCTASPSSTRSSPSTRRASRPSSDGTSAAIPSR